MSRLRTFEVRLITRGYYSGYVEAKTEHQAVERAFDLWRTACPHPFEKDDNELIDVIIEGEVTP